MSRHLLSVAIIVSFAAVRAEAIEMFTNFHNGENLGFPPMEVPIGMYPGFGRGGWAPGVVGAVAHYAAGAGNVAHRSSTRRFPPQRL